MKYHQVKYIRRTPKELKAFRKAVTYYMSEGYPLETAETKAWDHFWTDRKIKRTKVAA